MVSVDMPVANPKKDENCDNETRFFSFRKLPETRVFSSTPEFMICSMAFMKGEVIFSAYYILAE